VWQNMVRGQDEVVGKVSSGRGKCLKLSKEAVALDVNSKPRSIVERMYLPTN
jgi:hypothetical protein